MNDLESSKVLHKVAKAYYHDGLTQEKIGQRFGLSRMKVSRLLSYAREEKIVQIRIVAPQDGRVELEHAIEARYGVDEVLIAPATGSDPNRLNAALGETAAACLMRSLRGDETVTLTWGSSLLSTVEALQGNATRPIRDWAGTRIVQALGGLGDPGAEVYGAGLTHRLARTLGAKAHILSAPGIVPSPAVREVLLSDMHIARTLGMAAKANIALLGIGVLRLQSAGMSANILSADEFAELKALGAVGDIGLRFFNADGQLVDHEVNRRVLGLTLRQIKAIPRVLGVAGGPEKYEVIRAALRGKLINVLITDPNTAQRLLNDSATA